MSVVVVNHATLDGVTQKYVASTSSRTFDGRIQLLEYVPKILSGPPLGDA